MPANPLSLLDNSQEPVQTSQSTHPEQDINTSGSSKSGRVLIVAPQPFYGDRGTPIALRRVLEAVSERGDQIDLLTYSVGETIKLPGLRIFRVGSSLPIRNVPIGLSMRKVILDILMIPRILSLTSRENYRCVHAVEEAAFLVSFLRPYHKLSILYDMQSSLPEQLRKHAVFRRAVSQRVLKYFERWLIRTVDRIVCSAGLREHVLKIDPTAQVREWWFPVDLTEISNEELDRFRKDIGISPASRVVLYTGNFESYQGLSRLIGAIPNVIGKIPRTLFLLVGSEGLSHSGLGQEGIGLQKQGVLRLIPRQPNSMMTRYLAIADVVVSPREYGRNIGLKIFDYMVAGKPIVATNSPAHRAVLNDNLAVLVNLTPEELGGAIVRLLEDPEMAKRLGETAKAYADKNLTWKAFVTQVGDLHNPIGCLKHEAVLEKIDQPTSSQPESTRPNINRGIDNDVSG